MEEWDEKSTLCNLQDAGCDAQTTTAVMAALRQGEVDTALERLLVYRKELLANIHAKQDTVAALRKQMESGPTQEKAAHG